MLYSILSRSFRKKLSNTAVSLQYANGYNDLYDDVHASRLFSGCVRENECSMKSDASGKG